MFNKQAFKLYRIAGFLNSIYSFLTVNGAPLWLYTAPLETNGRLGLRL